MDIILDKTMAIPLYEQIVNQIKTQIVEGVLQPKTQLPSIRTLARTLGVSVITTKRAFDELEAQEYIVVARGKGALVAARDMNAVKEEYIRKIEEHLRSVALLSDFCGLNDHEIALMYQMLKRSKE